LIGACLWIKQARKVIVERLRRERIDRCLDQLKHWLQDTPLASQVRYLSSVSPCLFAYLKFLMHLTNLNTTTIGLLLVSCQFFLRNIREAVLLCCTNHITKHSPLYSLEFSVRI